MTGDWQLAFEAGDLMGEGPAWDAVRGSLLWTDIAGKRIHRLDPATGQTWARPLEQMAGAVLPRASGGLALCLQDGVYLTDSDDGEPRLLAPVEPDDETTRFNDVKTDRGGRLWGGTMAWDARADAGAFYRIEPDGTVETVSSSVTISNGIDWSLDGSLMYYIDTATGRMDVFDFDVASGAAGDRRPFIHFDEAFGLPDGMTVDAEGYPWVAFYDGWAVRRFTPAGKLDRTVELPAARITSCAFGGPDLGQLYVTSARDGLSDAELAEQPRAGSLFVIEPGVAGLPIHTICRIVTKVAVTKVGEEGIMKSIARADVPVDPLPGRGLRRFVGRKSSIDSEEMTVGTALYADEFGPMEPHNHAEETVYVLKADRAWVRWGPSSDDAPNRIDLQPGDVANSPAWEWHVYEWEPGGHLEILWMHGQIDNIRPEDMENE